MLPSWEGFGYPAIVDAVDNDGIALQIFALLLVFSAVLREVFSKKCIRHLRRPKIGCTNRMLSFDFLLRLKVEMLVRSRC